MTRAIGILAGALLVLPLTACSDSTADGESQASVSASLPSDAPSSDDVGDATESVGAAIGSAVQAACSGTTCEVTLSAGQSTDVLGTTLSFTSSADGTATIQAGDQSFTCTEGEDVSAGPVTLRCSDITDDSVTLSASLG